MSANSHGQTFKVVGERKVPSPTDKVRFEAIQDDKATRFVVYRLEVGHSVPTAVSEHGTREEAESFMQTLLNL